MVRRAVRDGAAGQRVAAVVDHAAAARANAIGGKVGQIPLPPPGFGVGQLIVLLSSTLIVAAAMAARGSVGSNLFDCGTGDFGAIDGAGVVVLPALRGTADRGGLRLLRRAVAAIVTAVVLSVLAMVAAWSETSTAPMTGFVEPVVLTGPRWVRLEPLTHRRRPGDRDGHRPTATWVACGSPARRRRSTAQAVGGPAAGGAAPRHRVDVRRAPSRTGASSARRATFTSTRRTGGSRSATPGSRSRSPQATSALPISRWRSR